MTKYQVLISDVRVFKITVQASNLEAANELADAALEAGYEEHGELAEVRDPEVADVYAIGSTLDWYIHHRRGELINKD